MFLGVIVLEIPSNVILHKVRIPTYLPQPWLCRVLTSADWPAMVDWWPSLDIRRDCRAADLHAG